MSTDRRLQIPEFSDVGTAQGSEMVALRPCQRSGRKRRFAYAEAAGRGVISKSFGGSEMPVAVRIRCWSTVKAVRWL